jgi:hypothetical protein
MNTDTTSKKEALKRRVAKVATYYHPRTWKEKGIWWTAGLFLVTYLILVSILGIYWSRSPAVYDVREQALSLANQDESKRVTGSITTATAIRIGETLLDKPGGYFAPVLEDKGASVSMKQITRELKNTQNTIWSPMILNGTGYGPMANQYLLSASYVSWVNAAVTDLRNLLQDG